MAMRRNNVDGLSPPLISALDEHLSRIRQRIAERAIDLAAETQSPEGNEIQVSLDDLTRAVSESVGSSAAGTRSAQSTRFFELFPPFTCICAALCVAFAILGLLALGGNLRATPGADLAKVSSGFLDIAKIFAGAIVGSTAASIVNVTRNRRGK
jgi:hypothetical protein